MRYYSCDSHVVEGREAFEGLAEHFGHGAPTIEKVDGEGEFLCIGDMRRVPVGRLGIAGHKLGEPETDAKIALGYEGLNPGVVDPVKRLAEQDQDGIAGEVMYPSLSMFTFAVTDPEIKAASFRQHNDWVLDYCKPNRDRLIGIGCLPVPDVRRVASPRRNARARSVFAGFPSRPMRRSRSRTPIRSMTRFGLCCRK